MVLPVSVFTKICMIYAVCLCRAWQPPSGVFYPSLSPQVVVIGMHLENSVQRVLLEISLGSGTRREGPISRTHHLATAHKGQGTGASFGEQTTSRGPAGLERAMCTARRCTVHDKEERKAPSETTK